MNSLGSFLFSRHRNEIIKFQSKIRNLQKELSVCHNGICKREDDKYGEENEINGLKETPESVTTQKKHCKDILLQALIAEVRIVLFYTVKRAIYLPNSLECQQTFYKKLFTAGLVQ